MTKDNAFEFEIISPQGIVFKDEVSAVSLPSYDGIITILPHHTPLFTKLTEGEIEIKHDGKTTTIVIAGGFLEIKSNSVHVLSDNAVRAENIETAKVLEKKRQTEDRLRQKLSNKDFTIADKDLKMSILELKVAEKVRRKQRA